MIKLNIAPWLVANLLKRKIYSTTSNEHLGRTHREEMLSVIFITFLCMIIFLMIVFSLFYIGKGYLEFLHGYQNEALLSIISFVFIGGLSLLTLLMFMKKNRERLILSDSRGGFPLLGNKVLLKLSGCFFDGFLEAIVMNMKIKS